MAWLEYNIHVRQKLTIETITPILSSILADWIRSFVSTHTELFNHWHYLLEPDKCRPSIPSEPFYEIRLRFEGDIEKLKQIKSHLVAELKQRTSLVMTEDEPLGSHEGRHGDRDRCYEGAAAESDAEGWTVGRDWEKIVEIWQTGSEFALKILQLGRGLEETKSTQLNSRQHFYPHAHPHFLHFPANQLIVEP